MLVNAIAHELPLPNKSIHCSVTSPPYFALRKYSGEQGVNWPPITYYPYPGLPLITIPAMKASLGLEPTSEAYIGHMVYIWRELRRALRDDGVCWLNIGDSFDAGNLMMIPHRLALALQADGWIVRNDVVWQKTNPCPESIRGPHWERHRIKTKNLRGRGTKQNLDRNDDGHQNFGGNPYAQHIDCSGCPKCLPNDGLILKRGSWRHTRGHEYVLMLTKKMGYWCDQEVIREPSVTKPHGTGHHHSAVTAADKNRTATADAANREPHRAWGNESGRNPRSVVTTSTANYKGTHYAVYPPQLIRSLIRSSTPTKCCPKCSKGWSPIIKRTGHVNKREPVHVPNNAPTKTDSTGWAPIYTGPAGYRPTCNCGISESIPGIVLDPFIGSGTTGLVAIEEGLRWIGTDISREYLAEQAAVRTTNIQLLIR